MGSRHSKFDFGRFNEHCLETPKAYQRPLLSLHTTTVSLLGCSCFLSLEGVMNGHMVDRTWSHSMHSRLHPVQDQQIKRLKTCSIGWLARSDISANTRFGCDWHFDFPLQSAKFGHFFLNLTKFKWHFCTHGILDLQAIFSKKTTPSDPERTFSPACLFSPGPFRFTPPSRVRRVDETSRRVSRPCIPLRSSSPWTAPACCLTCTHRISLAFGCISYPTKIS